MDRVAEAPEVNQQATAETKEVHGQSDIPGRVIGMLVFLLGVGMLILVFKVAYELFTQSPEAALKLKFTGDPKTDPTPAKIGTHFGAMLLPALYLFLMSIAGSLIAQKGVNLYFSASRGKHTP